ncbi:alcohol dehydrogenase GroES-like domain-containing protein [Stagonosporopsis vannaccii]|nr:alcohol dehydrogenase GroES-like domain-containing protein [Stagonosporopsis vannaccii]
MCGEVYAIDLVPGRLREAEQPGAIPLRLGEDPATIIKQATGGSGADAVLEIVGSAEAFGLSIDIARPFASISSVGVHTSTLQLAGSRLYEKKMISAFERYPARSVFEEALETFVQRKDRLLFLCGTKMQLEEAKEAYRDFIARENLRNIRVVGSLVGINEQLRAMLSFTAAHAVAAVTRTFALEGLNQLVSEAHRGAGGRLVVDMPHGERERERGRELEREPTDVTITDFDSPTLDLAFFLQEAEASPNHVLRLPKPACAARTLDPRADDAFHALATALFNNLSHVLELLWEKYLAEMHKYTAPGYDGNCIAGTASDLTNAWSTLVSAAASLPLRPDTARILACYVRLNDATYYTRTAGALMTPLSDDEYSNRKPSESFAW